MNTDKVNTLKGREQTEWATIWYDYADSVKDHKIFMMFMMGGSSARQIRGTLSKVTGKPCDLFGSSSALRDVLFWNQLDCFFKDNIYTYDFAIIWIGHHARTNINGDAPMTDNDYIRFGEEFEQLIQYVERICPKLIVLSNYDIVVPMTKKEKKLYKIRKFLHISQPKPKMDEAESYVINRKNEVIKESCARQGVRFLDINNIMKESGYIRRDHVHYVRKSDPYQVQIILDALKS